MPQEQISAFRTMTSKILSRFAISASAQERVCAAYMESWRTYHTIHHILGMHHLAVRLPLSIEDRWELCLLILYHDVWYKIGRESGENERKSAEWVIEDLKDYPGDQARLFALVRQGIEATITHTLDDVEPRFREIVSYLLDLDLWGLGQTRARFRKDTEAVWHEYEPMHTRAEFDRGRSAWAALFLKRRRIYNTQRFGVYEGDAYGNLTELASQAATQ